MEEQSFNSNVMTLTEKSRPNLSKTPEMPSNGPAPMLGISGPAIPSSPVVSFVIRSLATSLTALVTGRESGNAFNECKALNEAKVHAVHFSFTPNSLEADVQ